MIALVRKYPPSFAPCTSRHLALQTTPSAPINDCPRTIVRSPKPQLPIKRFPWRLFQV